MDSLNNVSSALCERSWGNCASSAGGRGNASAPLGCACCCAGGCLMRLGERTSSLYEDPRLAPYEVGGAACAPLAAIGLARANASSEGATGTSSASKTTGFFHPDHVSARELRMRRHAAPFGTSLLASTRMGPDTPEPRNSSLVAEKIPKRSLKILHLLGPNAWTWLDASSMEMKRLRASFHLSLSLAVAASGAEAPGAPFWVLPCLPNR
mmetsp:Transcript_4265/g.19015  ORF Transcript_4265/g.19015 Transcript_4265/m.19015 type:complete len:210 (-) Transcript_4265:772-1401(-)